MIYQENLIVAFGFGLNMKCRSHHYLNILKPFAEFGLRQIVLFLDMANESCLANSVEIGPRTAFGIETLLDEQANNSELAENLDVDIIECTNAIDNTGLAEVEDPYATEYSSSFDDTILQSEVDDAEVESRFCGKNDWQSAFDGFSSLLQMRKKKLTSHWRRFIRPLMWRCKWTELRIKELESQALHYGRELAAHYIRKKNQLELGQFDLKNLGSRSVPFSSQSSRKRAVKRRKRKKVECMADLNSYLSFHNLFSYFGISFPLYLSILVSPLTALPP